MMNDIIEEPEKDSLLETPQESRVLSVMPANAIASRANGTW